MDTSKKAGSAHLLDDLESIRQLLGDDATQPSQLTDAVHREGQIPLLFDMVGNRPESTHHDDFDEDDIPTLTPDAPHAPVEQVQQAQQAPQAPTPPNPDALLKLDSDLRAAAQLIMQDVIDDFAPHIETEIKRRLEARLERLLAQQPK
ncbi:DNA polymerase III subunit chi [Pseudomonas syringae]|uniref:DNA polymerase III subunit chi n=1 Tax=Pseudomonas syringae TaxID=317 RepID=A0A244ESQ2_PSESX|nr:DNA polymerase III subunit chi [Pseudomonas syringae]OUM07492.1 DNA polymerase III subunit chi [Pseudomonas syringae]